MASTSTALKPPAAAPGPAGAVTLASAPEAPARRGRLRLALGDIAGGISFWQLWGKLGWNDILFKYRRSFLGPFWLTASMAIMVVSLGVIYSRIFKTDIQEFIPFLCVGLLAWNFINSVMTEASTLFTGSEAYIKQIRLPFSLYMYRFIWSRVIIFAHNFIIYFGILIWFQLSPGWIALLALPAFGLMVLNGALASLYLGMIAARFRDIPQIINSLMQIVFFTTPIFWKPEFLGLDSALVRFNPFHHIVETMRAPLLGQWPTSENYLAVGLVTLFNLAVASAFFVRFRSRISYWV
jgi:ABC-2 type transport system permease protein/lipopolysaccharide transport system permease protein